MSVESHCHNLNCTTFYDLFRSDEIVETIDSDDIIELEENDLKMGLVFKNEEVAVKSIHLWSEKTFCPLYKVSLHFLV